MLELPDVFGFQPGPEQLAVVLPGAPELTEEELREAVLLCPVDAIRLLDDDDNDVTAD